jgi:MoxR-like ATPase
VLSYEALSEGFTADAITAKIMARVPAPAKPLAHEQLVA